MQICPFCVGTACEDSCPLFGEPDTKTVGKLHFTELQLCHGKVLHFSEFKDERE